MYVYDGDWPRGATRAVKETRSLVRAGHQVVLVARNTTHDPRRAREDGMEIERLPSVPWGPLNYAINFPVFISPFWFWAIWRAARRLRAECIVVADLPLAPTCLWVGRLLGIPVHYDMAEIYPEFLRSRWKVDRMRWSDHLVRNPAFAEWLERYVLRRVDRVFVVTPETSARMEQLGVAAQRLVVVGNTPEDPESLRSGGPMPVDVAPFKARLRLLFVGILVADRGVNDAVEAMPQVLREVPDASLVIVGDGTDRARIEATVRRLGLEQSVAVLGWKQHAELGAYYANCHVGLLPFRDSSHLRLTIANKLFDYMAAALPVVAADVPPMRRVIEETDCGVLFQPGNSASLAAAMVELLQDGERRRAMGERGQEAVQREYRWSEDERRFLEPFSPGKSTP